jgi:hypothetical protein
MATVLGALIAAVSGLLCEPRINPCFPVTTETRFPSSRVVRGRSGKLGSIESDAIRKTH